MARRGVVCALAALLELAASAALASEPSAVLVRTQDRSGAPFPGVVVQIRNARGLPVPAPKSTDGAGGTEFVVAPGPGYTVQVSVPGLATQTSEEFEIERGRRKTILFTMQEQIVEKVRVRGERVVDLDEGGENKLAFSGTFFDDLPILGRSYQNALKLAPGVNDSDGDGNPNVHGARERDFKATVDGVSNVDPLTGTFMSNINPDAIEEIEIITTGAGAEYGGAVGGFGKIITKQGSNSFDGNLSLYVRSSELDGNTIFTGTDADPISYHDVRPTLNFTGPVVKDTLFFALFHEYQDRGRPINFLGGGGIVIVTKGTRNLDKLTWQVGPRDKLIFQIQSDPLRIEPLGVDQLTDPRSGYAYKQGGPIYQVHWDSQISTVFNVQSLVGYSHTGISGIPSTNGIRNNCGIDAYARIGARVDPFGGPVAQPIDEDECFETLTSRTSGSYRERYADDRIRYTIRSDASYYLEEFLGVSHTLKAGVLAQKTRFGASDQYRGFSIFTESRGGFGGLNQVIYRGAGVLSRQVNNPGYPDLAQNRAEGSNFGLYFEDQFRPHPDLSLRVGLRVEQENMQADGFAHFDPADEYRRFQKGYGDCLDRGANPDICARGSLAVYHEYERFPVIGGYPFRGILEDPNVGLIPREPERFRISNTNLGPRFSISWDPGGSGRTKIFATAGRYYGETFLLIPLYEQPPDPFTFGYRVIADDSTTQCRPDSNGDGSAECITYPIIDSDQNARVSPASIRQVDRDLRTPFQDEFTAGFSREIFSETSITLTAIRRRYRDQFQDIDANHFGKDLGTVGTEGCVVSASGQPVPRDTRKDGKFDDCSGRVRVVGGVGGAGPSLVQLPDGIPDLYIRNPFFNQVNRVGNFNESEYRALQVELVRRLHRNWELEASYVWSEATGQAEDYAQTLGNDPTTVQDEEGYLSYDQRHVVKINARTQVPLWNVRLSSAISWQSGLPYSSVDVDTSYDAVTTFGNTAVQYLSQRTTYPTGQRNDQRSPAYWLVDVGARKDFAFGKTSFELSLDVINLLNSDALLVERVVNGNTIAVRRTGRQFQLGARLAF